DHLTAYTIFSLNAPPPIHTYTLSLHDALPISAEPAHRVPRQRRAAPGLEHQRHDLHLRADHQLLLADLRAGEEHVAGARVLALRSEEHTSELQSRGHIVCRLLLEKKNKTMITY